VVVDFSKVYIIERYGKYVKTLPPGIHYLIPLVDRIAYVHSIIKNQSIEIPAHLATTKDNVPIYVEGLLFFEVCPFFIFLKWKIGNNVNEKTVFIIVCF
jgi:regulator of protease activity HflC (stomatin/prohibitin superfamily)